MVMGMVSEVMYRIIAGQPALKRPRGTLVVVSSRLAISADKEALLSACLPQDRTCGLMRLADLTHASTAALWRQQRIQQVNRSAKEVPEGKRRRDLRRSDKPG